METLFEHICAESTLFDAWQRIERKGAQGGIDRISVATFHQRLHENLTQLRADLLSSRYVPEPFHKIAIPKADTPGETRPLQLPTVRDKIAQEAVRSVIAPILEKTFVDCSYAYRPGKGPQKAIRRVEHYLSVKKPWVAVADIDRFFDTMDQALTLTEVKQHIAEPEILRLLALWITMGAMDRRGRWVDPVSGVAQGSVISPLLSNVYLTPFDTYLTQKGHAVVRYADNFILLAPSNEAVTKALEDARSFLHQQLKLHLNAYPRPVASLEMGFVFLGIYFCGQFRRIAKSKGQQMQAEIRHFWQRYTTAAVPQLVAKLNESLLGWQRYYGMVQPVEQFQELDSYVAEGLARALALRMHNGRLSRNADLRGMLADLAFLSHTPQSQRSAAIARIVHRARALHTEKKESHSSDQGRGTRVHQAFPKESINQKTMVARETGALLASQAVAPTLEPALHQATTPKCAPSVESPTLQAPDTVPPPSASVAPQGTTPAVASPMQQVASAVRKQKRRYLQRAVHSAELIISEPGVFLGKTSKRVVVKKQRRVIAEMPLRQLRHVMITAPGVTLSSAMITFCARAHVPLDFLSPRGEPLARLSTPLDALGTTGLQQLYAVQDGRGLLLAKTFVDGKLRNQFNLVKYYHKYRKRVDANFAHAFDEVEQQFVVLLAALKSFAPLGDYDMVRQKLFAFEGQGGNLYWQMIRLLLEDDVPFAGRQRQGATDLVNSLLNYGYGMLYPRVHHALLLAGLHPGISFLHSFQDGKPTLSFDLIEEFRAQAVDRVVFGMITKGEPLAIDPQAGYLTKDTVQKLVRNVLERIATPIPYRSGAHPLQEIIHLQAKRLAAHLHGKARYRPFIGRW